jgi:hypothetical protein
VRKGLSLNSHKNFIFRLSDCPVTVMPSRQTAGMKKTIENPNALNFSWQAATYDPVILPNKPYAQMRDQLKTGDLVLFSGRSFAARLVRGFTGSRWSHVGLVVRLPEMPQTPLLWEATRASKVHDIIEGKPFDGVQLVALDDRIASYQGLVAVRRLQHVHTDAQARAHLESLIDEWRAKPYRNFVRQHISAWVRGEEALSFSRGGFCSELVAEVYRRWLLLPKDRPAHHYVPRDFGCESGVPLLRGVLSPACLMTI